MTNAMNRRRFLTTASAAGLASLSGCIGERYDHELLNVSYDATRELYRAINRLFAAHYLEKTGQRVRVRQSHGGSGSQARAVADGIPADVVSLATWADVDSIRAKGLMEANWEGRFPNQSLPYLSTIVFVVREGNPKHVKNWPDLLKDGLQIITPNPKTSGGAKLNLLGAWLYQLHAGRSPAQARAFVTELFRRVPVLDSGARGATMTFARKGLGDVHLTWENEAELEKREMKGAVEIIRPPVSIQAEPHVALVDANTARKGTTEVARAYLEFLYTPAAQSIVADMFFRPVDWEKDSRFAKIELLRATDPQFHLGDWNAIQKDFFGEGGIFDRIVEAGR
jgi:sulfate/thiosulfate transport system substrate-binding protein